MEATRCQRMTGKHFLSYHWTRDLLSVPQVVYQGYIAPTLDELDDDARLVHVRGQEAWGPLRSLLMPPLLDRLIHNPLFVLPMALSIRRKLYLRLVNRTNRLSRCGHFVVTCRKT